MDSPTRALFGFTALRMALSVKGLLFGLMAAFPWGVTLLLRLLVAKGIPVPLGGITLYGMVVFLYVCGFLLPLSTLFFGVGLIADEREGGTLPYLFGRPVPRARLFLVRYAAMSAVIVAGCWASVLGTYVLGGSEAGAGALGREAGTLLLDLGVVGLGALVYGALFAFLGLSLKRPLFAGLLIGFGWENAVAYIPGFLKRLTVLFHLHTLLPHGGGPTGIVQQMLSSSERKTAALLVLVFYGVLFVGLACFVIRRLEAASAQEADA